MSGSNGYFEHDREVIDFAYRLVKEYDDHETNHDRAWARANPSKLTNTTKRSKIGGMLKKDDT